MKLSDPKYDGKVSQSFLLDHWPLQLVGHLCHLSGGSGMLGRRLCLVTLKTFLLVAINPSFELGYIIYCCLIRAICHSKTQILALSTFVIDSKRQFEIIPSVVSKTSSGRNTSKSFDKR